MVSTKLPAIKKMIAKSQKPSKGNFKTNSKAKHVPHYMQLRQQDVDNKLETKKKIKDIKASKPQLISTPRKKWIPLKIEPKGAALNARFYKGKPKPSIEVNRSDNESSMARIHKFRRNANHSEFDRSESHCRRCEA